MKISKDDRYVSVKTSVVIESRVAMGSVVKYKTISMETMMPFKRIIAISFLLESKRETRMVSLRPQGFVPSSVSNNVGN